MVIYPEVIVTPDTPTVRFNQPREKINLEVELPRILQAQGWGCGTYFNVQFLNHEKTKVMACARFVVSEELENTTTTDANPYQPMTKTVFTRRAEQIEAWWPHEDVDPPFLEEVTRTVVGTSSEYRAAMDSMKTIVADANKRSANPPSDYVEELPKRRGRQNKAA